MKKSYLSCMLLVCLGVVPLFGYGNYGGYDDYDDYYNDDYYYDDDYDDYDDDYDDYDSSDCCDEDISEEEFMDMFGELMQIVEQSGVSEVELMSMTDEELDEFLTELLFGDYEESMANEDYDYDEEDYGSEELTDEDFMEFLNEQGNQYSEEEMEEELFSNDQWNEDGSYFGNVNDDNEDKPKPHEEKPQSKPHEDNSSASSASKSTIGTDVLAYAKQYTERFIQYNLGSQDFLRSVNIDCSGLVINCYRHALANTNYKLPFNDTDTYNLCYRYSTPTRNPEKGDLVFMTYSSDVDHVGIFDCISNGEVYFIDATPNYYNKSGSAVNRRHYPIGDNRLVSFGKMKLVKK